MIKHIIFDFDGVIANTNKLKVDLLAKILSENFNHPNEKIIEFIKLHPGLNRNLYINKLEDILDKKINKQKTLNQLSHNISSILDTAEINPYLKEIRDHNKSINWYVITSGDEQEVKIFLKKNLLDGYFRNVRGGTDNKYLSFVELKKKYNIKEDESLIIGDGSKDYDLIKRTSIKGFLIKEWSQEPGFLISINSPKVVILKKIKDLRTQYKKYIK